MIKVTFLAASAGFISGMPAPNGLFLPQLFSGTGREIAYFIFCTLAVILLTVCAKTIRRCHDKKLILLTVLSGGFGILLFLSISGIFSMQLLLIKLLAFTGAFILAFQKRSGKRK